MHAHTDRTIWGKKLQNKWYLSPVQNPEDLQYTGCGTHCVLGKNNPWIQWLEVFFGGIFIWNRILLYSIFTYFTHLYLMFQIFV